MKVFSLSCDSCGAKLDVPAKVKFVTCAFCDTRLKVQHEETSVFTQAIDELSSQLRSIKRDTSITRLDQEWEVRRDRYRMGKSRGSQSLPSQLGGVLAIVVGLIMGAFMMRVEPMMGLLTGALFTVSGLWTLSRAKAYQKDLARYRKQRRELMRS